MKDKHTIEPDKYSEHSFWQTLQADNELGKEILSLLDVGEYIWQKGWAEANAGNVSIRLPDSLDSAITAFYNNYYLDSRFVEPVRAGETVWLLMSASGSRYREFQTKGFDSFVLAGFDSKANNIVQPSRIIVCPDTRKPTSEWKTHLAVQHWLWQNRNTDRVVLHAHPTDWIIISNSPVYQNAPQDLLKEIYDYLPELNIYLPGGFSLLPYAEPGSAELSSISLKALQNSIIVIWEKHGILITAANSALAYDYLEIMSKAAKVYLAIHQIL